MAFLLLPLNGIGLGHLTRALIFAEWLREAGRRPMIALQGPSQFAAHTTVPTTNVPWLHSVPKADAQRIAQDLVQSAKFSSPSVIIEDTHPAPVKWPEEMHHIIVVRPTIIDHMRKLHRLFGSSTARILVCDHPATPTWPYNADETQEILSWTPWSCLGPIFRTATSSGIEGVRKRHNLNCSENVFVFSMGGGGERKDSGDRAAFITTATTLASNLRRRTRDSRFLFIRGPLFPSDISLPTIFEDVREESDLPSLFQIARGAVIRPGYNVTWECIAAGTPFIAIPGSYYCEPVGARLASLARHGIESSSDVDRLLDPDACERFSKTCAGVVSGLTGSLRQRFLEETNLVEDTASIRFPPPAIPKDHGLQKQLLHKLSAAIREAKHPIRLRIRLDDVTRFDGEIAWLFGLCRDMKAFLSLEIIPYHNGITGAALDVLDPDGIADVSQHGYAHFPQYPNAGHTRGEFVNCHVVANAIKQLERGAAVLRKTFGSRFRGGYSAPYDLPPRWLCTAWRDLGGRYLSWIRNCPTGGNLPHVKVSVDLWSWQNGAPVRAEQLINRIVSGIERDGDVGIVLHPQCLHNQEQKQMAAALLHCLITAGCVSAKIDPHVRPGAEPPNTRVY